MNSKKELFFAFGKCFFIIVVYVIFFSLFQKTLIVIESVLHRSVPNAQEIFASQLLSKFESLCSSSQKAIRNKSTKVGYVVFVFSLS